MKPILNHVAFLVSNVENSAKVFQKLGYFVNPAEEFAGEGTNEIYIGTNDERARPLLLQAINDGPYRRALQKRGTGLHHIAIDVKNIDAYLKQLEGWELHQNSMLELNKTAFLFRKGVPFILEVSERNSKASKNLVSEIHLHIENLDVEFIRKLNIEEIKITSSSQKVVFTNNNTVEISKFISL